MGALAVTVTMQWSRSLLQEIALEPVKITLAVLIAGIGFKFLQKTLSHRINSLMNRIGIRPFIFLSLLFWAFFPASYRSIIISALFLAEIAGHLKLDRKSEIKLVVICCFSIGLGAALTPLGEPLSTIAISQLKNAPYFAGFWFLLRHLGPFIIPMILLLGIFGALIMRKPVKTRGLSAGRDENFRDILLRTGKVYLFIAGLIMLGTGFKPFMGHAISRMPAWCLYWVNTISAVVDNATLAAVEIGPSITLVQIKAAVLGLLISGGMLIPGNIPNIISAGKLKIRSSEWARVGVPVGLAVMSLCFVILLLFII